MAKVESFIEHHGSIQRDVKETVEFLKGYVADMNIKSIFIVTTDEDDRLSLICGSDSRNYNLQEINWDIDQVKTFLHCDEDECE